MDEIVRHRLVCHDVRDGESPAGPDDPEHLPEHLALVRRQVDDAVGNDEIGAAVLDRKILRVAFAELDVRRRIAEVLHHDRRVPSGQCKHLVGHVYTDDPAGRADTTGGFEAVDTPARPDVQYGLPWPDRRQAGRRAAPVGHAQHFLRDEGSKVVEVVPGRAAHLLAGGHRSRVPLTDLLRDCLVWHEHLARRFILTGAYSSPREARQPPA